MVTKLKVSALHWNCSEIFKKKCLSLLPPIPHTRNNQINSVVSEKKQAYY